MKFDTVEPAVRKGWQMTAIQIAGKAEAYVQLCKPGIILLYTVTGLASLVLQPHDVPFAQFIAILTGILLTGASANALNQYLDRDIDAVMERTRRKRPLPSGRVTPEEVLWASFFMGAGALVLLLLYGNWLAAILGMSTIVYYDLIYTYWLKRRTPYNIVIGGAAGATAPLIGWAAITDTVGWPAVVMFLIVFLWTPPHFWSLALCLKDEYAKVSVPMLPVVSGSEVTRRQILIYTVVLIPVTVLFGIVASLNWIYFVGAVVLGAGFLKKVIDLYKGKSVGSAWKTFGYSIVYLLALFVLMLASPILSSVTAAAAELPPPLTDVGIDEKQGTAINGDIVLRDEEGRKIKFSETLTHKRPSLLMFVYYECPSLCSLFLNGVVSSLKTLPWTAGKEFNVVTISIDPSETPELAQKKKASYLAVYQRTGAESGWRFLVNDEQKPRTSPAESVNAGKLADSAGFRYRFDKESNQFAHPTALVVLTPAGKIARYLYGINFKAKDLRLALTEAGEGKTGGIIDRVLLYCYHYDSSLRGYSLSAERLMKVAGAIIVVACALLIVFLTKASRRSGHV